MKSVFGLAALAFGLRCLAVSLPVAIPAAEPVVVYHPEPIYSGAHPGSVDYEKESRDLEERGAPGSITYVKPAWAIPALDEQV